MLATFYTEASKKLLSRILLLLVLALISSWYVIYGLRKNLKMELIERYSFDQETGYYLYPKTKEPVCARCLAKETVSRLRDEGEGWRCPVCGTTYPKHGWRE